MRCSSQVWPSRTPVNRIDSVRKGTSTAIRFALLARLSAMRRVTSCQPGVSPGGSLKFACHTLPSTRATWMGRTPYASTCGLTVAGAISFAEDSNQMDTYSSCVVSKLIPWFRLCVALISCGASLLPAGSQAR